MQLFPNLKKCVIRIPRQKLDRFDVLKLKQEEGGGWVRSGDSEPSSNWMKPLDLDDGRYSERLRFVKKVEVKVQEKNNHANESRGPCSRSKGPDVVIPNVIIANPTNWCRYWKNRIECIKETKEQSDNITNTALPELDHNYSLNIGDTPDGNDQSQPAR